VPKADFFLDTENVDVLLKKATQCPNRKVGIKISAK
jgi:hypothetical protein